jgi:hypothetical protein
VRYRGKEGPADIHLAWDDFLEDTWDLPLDASVVPDAPGELLTVAAAFARRVWRRWLKDRRFPYDLGDQTSRFGLDGALLLGSRSAGLTCATFALALLRTAGITLVDFAEWPVRSDEDRLWLASISGWADRSVVQRMTTSVEAGALRVKPEEAFAACMLAPPPAAFATLAAVAADVARRLAHPPTGPTEA